MQEELIVWPRILLNLYLLDSFEICSEQVKFGTYQNKYPQTRKPKIKNQEDIRT